MIDAGMAIGTLDQDTCLSILADAGYSKEEGLNRVRAIRLAPASRVLPVLGQYELNQLRTESGLSTSDFCTRLFAHGQLPLQHLGYLLAE